MDDPSTSRPPGEAPAEAPAETAPALTLPDFTPVPRLKDRSNGWKPAVQRAFIEALAETGSVAAACRRVGRSDHGVYQLRRHPEAQEFRAAWDAALDLGVRRIEDAAMDRALYGTEETVHYHGELVATHRRFNERLVMFILRNRAPHRFAAGGGARGLNAVDRMEQARLKRKWRREWEREQAESEPSHEELLDELDTRIAEVQERRLACLSPRAIEWEIAAEAQKRADKAAGWEHWLPYPDYAEAAEALLPKFIDEVRAEYPAHKGRDPAPAQAEEEEAGNDDTAPAKPLALPGPTGPTDPPAPTSAAPSPDPSLDEARARILALVRERGDGAES